MGMIQYNKKVEMNMNTIHNSSIYCQDERFETCDIIPTSVSVNNVKVELAMNAVYMHELKTTQSLLNDLAKSYETHNEQFDAYYDDMLAYSKSSEKAKKEQEKARKSHFKNKFLNEIFSEKLKLSDKCK